METILTVFLALVSVALFILGCLQFAQKGPLLNNAFLYASQKERKAMNQTPHYRQSGVVFCCLGVLFALNAVEAALRTGWLTAVMLAGLVALILFAFASSVYIVKKYK